MKGEFRLLLSVAAVTIAAALWLEGMSRSPLLDVRRQNEAHFVANHIRTLTPNAAQERILAENYWRRYRDVRNDTLWGENGPMGIWGPRDHYRLHGQREGRIFAPLVIPPDLAAEKSLARTYWHRYPDVRHSSIWGEQSDLGILGPRDHYIYIGTPLGYVWGLVDVTGTKAP
jgi:hypothetical protein